MKLAAWIIRTLIFCIALDAPLRAASAAPTMPTPLNLKIEQNSDFFRFFHLVEVGAPTPLGASQAWHSFRPDGLAFHALVELDVLANGDGTIGAASFGIDRSFIDDPRNGVFARDIVKSFLIWTDRSPSDELKSLISNLADLSHSGTMIIMRGAAPPSPPPDATGAYAVYLGHSQRAAFTDNGISFTVSNFPGALPAHGMFEPVTAQDQTKPDWLRLDVRFGT